MWLTLQLSKVKALWQVSAHKCRRAWTSVSNGGTVWERQLHMHTRKWQSGELISWFFLRCSAGERQGGRMVWSGHHVRHKHILLEFTCLLFRFGCTCSRCFQEELLGIDGVNSAGASVRKACIHCACMLDFPRLQGKYCDLMKWIVIRIPP